MPRKCFTAAFTLIACGLAWSSHATAASPNTIGRLGMAKLADSPIEVLSGRLTVRMPQGAKVQARPHAIMGAPESNQRETRITFDAGQERMVLMASETFALAGDDFQNDLRKLVTQGGAKYGIEPLQHVAKGLEAVTVTPIDNPDHSRGDDAAFVEGIFVVSPDRTIQSLEVYVNAAGEKDMAGCKRVAHQILSSVAQGKQKLQLAAGQRRLFAYSKDAEISIIVPQNTVATMQVGDDFLVHRLSVLGRLGVDSGSIGIYVGGHPQFQPASKTTKGTMFGKKIEWQSARQDRRLETLCELPIPGEKDLKAHVWIQAPNKAQLTALREAAETMKVVKPEASPAGRE
jgi:hypothetical protein